MVESSAGKKKVEKEEIEESEDEDEEEVTHVIANQTAVDVHVLLASYSS